MMAYEGKATYGNTRIEISKKASDKFFRVISPMVKSSHARRRAAEEEESGN
jgi:hypothetical protein